jgi:hypothetical protein
MAARGHDEADAAHWAEVFLPELTAAQRTSLRRAGFELTKLQHLARTKYGRSLVVSVLVCFTDAYPQAAAAVDIARAGEANRMITSRSAAEFEHALQAHGLSSAHAGTVPAQRAPQASERAWGGYPTTATRWWLGWFLVVLLALVLLTLLAGVDIGFGIVLGVIWLIAGYALVVRRTVFGRTPVPARVRRSYLWASVALVIGAVGASNAWLIALGSQGVGRIDSASELTGSHGTRYSQCSVVQPDGNTADLRATGSCPKPDGAPVTMVYVPSDSGSPWRPALGTKGDLEPLAGLWGVGTLVGCGLLVRAARR